jgi:hypothetical protein
MTTLDITSGLRRTGVESSVVDDFRRFLDSCDLVKFAKNRPDAKASTRVLALGRDLVERTIPVPDPDPAPPEAELGADTPAHTSAETPPNPAAETQTDPAADGEREETRT